MIVSPEHFELNQKYQKLLLKSMQQEKFLEKAEENYKLLASKITPLQNTIDKFAAIINQQQEEKAELLKELKEKEKMLQRLELIEHQYNQLQRLTYASRTEKSSVTAGQLLLELDVETVEACNINDGQRIASYTKQKAEKKPHPGRNPIPAHIPRTYIDMYPDNLPEGAELIDTIVSEVH